MTLSSGKTILSALMVQALCLMQFPFTDPHSAVLAADATRLVASKPMPLPNPATPTKPTTGTTPEPSGVMATMWKACFEIHNDANGILQQGKNWYPRKDWLTYYSSNIDQYLTIIDQELSKAVLPAAAVSELGDDWAQIKPLVTDMRNQLAALTTAIADVPDQVPETEAGMQNYPKGKFKFHDPASNINDDADKLNKLLIDISRRLGDISANPGTSAGQSLVATSSASQQSNTTSVASTDSSSGSSGTTLHGAAQVLRADVGIRLIGEASKKIQDSSNNLLQELERWNLLWGHPPAGGTPNIMYGGGLTPAEVLSQYYYLPSFAFTEPGYLRFSYRLPPRQKFLVLYTTQIGKMINLMGAEIDDTKFPPDQQLAVSGPWSVMQDIFKDMVSNYMELLKYVNESSDERLKKDIREDQLEFGKPTLTIHDDMSKLTNVLADVKSVIQQ